MTRRLALAGASALLFTVAMRPWGHGLAAVIAVVPLELALRGAAPARAALLTWLAWLGLALPVFESASLVIAWSTPALVALYGLPWAAVGWSRARLPVGSPLALPLLVTAAEYLVGSRWLLGDLAFSLLAYTQADTPLRGLAAWSGVSGPACAAASVGSLLAWAWGSPRRVAGAVGATVALLALAALPSAAGPATGEVRVGVVQSAQPTMARLLAPSTRAAAQEHGAPFLELTVAALAAGADLVVWGETVLPEAPDGSLPPVHRAALELAPAALVGTVERAEDGVYNAVLAQVGGEARVVARKQTLVPLVEAPYGHGAPTDPVMLQGALVGAFVCLDSLHGALSRESVRRGAELLVYLTDDTFAGRTATPWFHVRTARLRAVEVGRAVVFANEAGPSALIAPIGAVLAVSAAREPVALVANVPLMGGTTPFAVLGDWVGPAAPVGVVVLFVLFSGRRWRWSSMSYVPRQMEVGSCIPGEVQRGEDASRGARPARRAMRSRILRRAGDQT